MLPKDALTKLMIRQAINALNAVSATLEKLKAEMLELSSQLPEYPAVMEMRGVGDSLGPQLMAEIGDVMRFARRSAITSFAGVDPGADQSGGHEAKSVPTSKSGPPELRKALFLVMDHLIQTKPLDDPAYQFDFLFADFLHFLEVGLPSGRVGLKFRADGAAAPVYAPAPGRSMRPSSLPHQLHHCRSLSPQHRPIV